MTNQEFADSIGCTVSMASRLRNGKRSPSVDTMWKIHKAHRISMEDLGVAAAQGQDMFGKLLRERVFGATG